MFNRLPNWIGSILILFFATKTIAADTNCSPKFENVLVYKEALKLKRKKPYQGFLAFCQLAYLGDHRAQFQLAKYYFNGIEGQLPVSENEAYVWAVVSNSYFKEVRKQKMITRLAKNWEKSRLEQLNKQAKILIQERGSYRMIDRRYNPNKHPARKFELGTHIKRAKQE